MTNLEEHFIAYKVSYLMTLVIVLKVGPLPVSLKAHPSLIGAPDPYRVSLLRS